MKAHHRRTSLQPADRRLNTAKAHLKSDWLKVSVRPSVLHAESDANRASNAASMRVAGHAERPPLLELLETPERASEVPLEQIPALVAKVASEQAALSAIQGVLTARLLVTPTSHDSGADPDRLLTAEEVAHLLGVTKRWVQRRARRLPFARQISVRSVRYSESGLRRWLATRRDLARRGA
jgi:predicted DNA-binding transcriptional regulator AlpA